jgi:glycosyltransferase involved in cell wall biosynthesis
VHAHLLAAGLYGGLAARIMKVPAVYTAHGVLAVNAPLRFAEIAIRHLFRAIVGVSRHGEIELRRYILGKKRQKVRCIYNGIDTDYWVMTPGREQLFPRDGRSIKLTMVANFFKEKDHWTALEAFLLFRGKYPNSCLTLAGDGEQRDQVESWVRQIQISNVLLTGAVEDIRSLLMRTDIFVLASFTEGISIAVLEAMAMGLPVVASDVGGMREIITHGVDGFLVPPRDPQAFFQAVDTLIAQPLLRVSLGQKARERVISAFSVTAMTSAYQSLYHELLGTAR